MLLHCSLPSPAFDKYVYIHCNGDAFLSNALCSCFISSPKLMFHFDLCCHLRRCKSYFVWHEWDIFCLIKFKLYCSFRLSSVQFGVHSVVWLCACVCMWCNFSVDGGLFSFYMGLVSMQLCCCLLQIFIALAKRVWKMRFANASDIKRTCDANANKG